MAIIDSILQDQEKIPPISPVADKSSWMKELIDKRYQPKTERIKRNPVGFDFKREPFDPSSYYRQLGSFRQISENATNVVRQEVSNREQAEYERNMGALNGALGGVNANFTYDGSGKSKKYKLKGVSSHVASQADYLGSMFGISNIGGYRHKGSVPGSDHPRGLALDFMTKNRKQGTSLANYAVSNAKRLKIKYVIWYRKIWSPGKGWRNYSGPSAHTDHVHISYLK